MSNPLQPTRNLSPTCRESAVRFAGPDRTLAGTLVLPDRPAGPGIVFVHGWSGIRSGPHGLLTTVARELGAAGFPSLRFDLGGRGESTGDGTAANLTTMAEDLVAAVQTLRERSDGKEVILCGMCSGGNVAIGTLPRLGPVTGLLMYSVYPFSDGDSFGRDVHRTWHFAKVYWHKMGNPETWTRLVRGDINIKQVFNVLFGHFRHRDKETTQPETETPTEKTRTRATPDPSLEGRKQKDPPRKHLENLTRGTPARMIYGGADPDADASRQYFGSFAEERGLPIEIVDVDGANHNFSSRRWTEEIVRLSIDFCRSVS